MTYKIKNCKISMYADDHWLFVSGKSPQEVEREMNSDKDYAIKWYQDNILTANKDNYQAMVIWEKKLNVNKLEGKGNVLESE